MTAQLFTAWFTEYFKPAVETYCSGKKVPFKTLLLVDNAPAHPRALKEMYGETDVALVPANAAPTLQPVGQGVISAFRSY